MDAEILDLSDCQDFDCDSTTWLSSTLDSQKVKTIGNHKRGHHQKKQKNNNNILYVPVSAEEMKIRSELEMKIKRDLEEEIKEGIYHLALRLHSILLQRKERDAKEESEYGNNNRTRALSEVNISIRMEGGTKIEIKEVNKETGEKGCPSPRTYRPKNVKEVKKVDWVKTLRTGSSPVAVNRSYVSSKHRDIMVRRRKNNASVDNKVLRLGWKV